MGEKGTRWKYYRCRAEGGNNLVINPGNGPDQNVRARAPVVRAELQVKSPRVVLDLSAACSHSSGKLLRGFQLVDREGLLIVDEIELEKPSEVYWFVHTRAKVRLIDDGRIAVLRKGRKRCEFRILQPSTAQWSVGPAVPLPSSPKPKGSNPNNGYLRLAIHLTGVKSERIAVWMAESRRTVPIEKARVSLAKW
jgi:hypothetical protein